MSACETCKTKGWCPKHPYCEFCMELYGTYDTCVKQQEELDAVQELVVALDDGDA